MFFRQKPSGSRTYFQIVENVREGGQVLPLKPEAQPLLLDVDRLQQTVVTPVDRAWIVRTPASGYIAAVLCALGLALPPRTRPLDSLSTPSLPPAVL
jgi:hypothetical protein